MMMKERCPKCGDQVRVGRFYEKHVRRCEELPTADEFAAMLDADLANNVRTLAKALGVGDDRIRGIILTAEHPKWTREALNERGLLAVQETSHGQLLDAGASRAFAVADHQAAHVYVRDVQDQVAVQELLRSREKSEEQQRRQNEELEKLRSQCQAATREIRKNQEVRPSGPRPSPGRRPGPSPRPSRPAGAPRSPRPAPPARPSSPGAWLARLARRRGRTVKS